MGPSPDHILSLIDSTQSTPLEHIQCLLGVDYKSSGGGVDRIFANGIFFRLPVINLIFFGNPVIKMFFFRDAPNKFFFSIRTTPPPIWLVVDPLNITHTHIHKKKKKKEIKK